MATQRNLPTLRGIGIPWPLTPAHIWWDEADFEQQGPQPGQAEPQGRYVLGLDTSGTQSADGSLTIRTQRAGNPGPNGAAFIWKHTDDDEDEWRGRDIQQISAASSVEWVGVDDVVECGPPDVLSLPTGEILAVYQVEVSSGSQYRVRVAIFDPDSWTWTKTDIHASNTAPTDGYHPAIAVDGKGYVYVAHWIYDNTAQQAQIRIRRSTDRGSTWTEVSPHALEIPVDISGSPGSGADGYTCKRIRFAFNGGQCLLIAMLTANDTSRDVENTLCQYASTADAGRFELVDMGPDLDDQDSFGYHSILVLDGTFYVGHVGFLGFYWTPLPSAYATFSARWSNYWMGGDFVGFYAAGGTNEIYPTRPNTDDSDPGSAFTDGDSTVWADEAGTLYACFRVMNTGQTPPTAPNAVFMIMSFDRGVTWKYAGDGERTEEYADGAAVYYSGSEDTYLRDFVGCTHRGRQVLLSRHVTEDGSAHNDSIGCYFLGGYTEIELPARLNNPFDFQRSGWTETWTPIEEPQHTTWAVNIFGSGSETIEEVTVIRSEVALHVETNSGQRFYTQSPTSSLSSGIIVRGRMVVLDGGDITTNNIAMRIRCANGTSHYEAAVRFSEAQIRAVDVQDSSSTIDDVVAITMLGLDVLMAITSNGEFSFWYRPGNLDSDRNLWLTLVEGHQLVDGGATGTSTNQIAWGHISTGTAESAWFDLHYMAGARTHNALGPGFSNPDDLIGRDYPARGRHVYLDDGVRITSRDGAAMRGESYRVDVAYELPIERIFHHISPTPRVPWRTPTVSPATTANAEQFIPLLLNDADIIVGDEEQGMGNSLLYFHFAGSNFRTLTIERRDTSGPTWEVEANVNAGITFTGVRRGNEVIPGGSTSTGPYFAENECRGWYIDLGINTIRRVAGNSSGTLAGSGFSGKKCSFFLEGATGFESTGGTFRLFPDQFTVLVPVLSETASAWGIRITSQRTSTGYIQLGHFSMGRVFVPGLQYGRGRILTYSPNTPTKEQPDGILRSIELGPGGEELQIAWTDLLLTEQTYGGATTPDYRSISDGVSSAPVAVVHDTAFSLEGILREVGYRTPVLVLPAIPQSPNPDTPLIRRGEQLLATFASEVQMESVSGEEMMGTGGDGEVFRTATVALRKVS